MKTSTRVVLGLVLCLGNAFGRVPSLQHGAWGEALLLFAALVVVPLLTDVVARAEDYAGSSQILNRVRRFQFGAAFSLVVAYRLSPGFLAVLAALPWATVLGMLASVGLRGLFRGGERAMSRACGEAGLLYAAVAALWMLADRGGLRPMNFERDIVLLTAIHFHYAGLTLPVLTQCALLAGKPNRWGKLLGLGAILGVPAVAVGITATQLRLAHEIEVTATLFMAASGVGVALLHLKLAGEKRWATRVRILWVIAGASLLGGMFLAALYGMRGFFHPFPWLDIPWMRALHGSLNALGFSASGTLGWWFVIRGPLVNKNQNSGLAGARG